VGFERKGVARSVGVDAEDGVGVVDVSAPALFTVTFRSASF